MRGILAVIRKELRQIRRTKAYFALIFVAPFAMLLILGSAITNEVKNVPLAVVDLDHTPMSRRIVDVAAATPSFAFIGTVPSTAAAKTLLDNGTAKIVIVVPLHFERDVTDGRAPSLQLLIDGVDGNSAGVALGYVTAMLARVQSEWIAEGHVPTTGVTGPAPSVPAHVPPITVVTRMWYNPNLESKLNFVPGLIGILLIMMTTFLTAINIVREREIGTLEQIMVTPLRGIELIIGKIVPYTILGFAQLTISVVAAGLVFGIWMKGSLLLFYAMAAVFCLSTLGLGIFVSTLARTQAQAMFMAWFIMIFALLLSGFFVPIGNMPRLIQDITYVNPLRYFITVLREIYLKGTPFRYLWKEAAAMGAIGLAALVFAAVRFQKRLK